MHLATVNRNTWDFMFFKVFFPPKQFDEIEIKLKNASVPIYHLMCVCLFFVIVFPFSLSCKLVKKQIHTILLHVLARFLVDWVLRKWQSCCVAYSL